MIPVLVFKLEGVERLNARLESLDRKMHKSVIGKAARVALKPVLEKERARIRAIPSRGGNVIRETMAKSLGVSVDNRGGVTTAKLRISYRGKPTNRLAHLFEWGFHHVGGKEMPAYLMATQPLREEAAGVIARFAAECGKRLDELGVKEYGA